MANINPNSDKDFVNEYKNLSDSDKCTRYPQFFNGIKFETFRHLKNVEINFNNPITVISGCNKSGKTTSLLSIACSHYNFLRKNNSKGAYERSTWGDIMRITSKDLQSEDWVYYVTYREGNKIVPFKDGKGYRKLSTKKWGGVAKKESQIGTKRGVNGRHVYLLDLERINTSKNMSGSLFRKAKRSTPVCVDDDVNKLISYILQTSYNISNIASIEDKKIYSYDDKYSSYNTASGEDVLTRMLTEIVEAPDNSLILIEEIEIGLHPSVQRRLMDVLYYESRYTKKQFIITTHSSSILSYVDDSSRIFLDNNKVIYNISLNEALTRMDSESHPLFYVFVEDEESSKIVEKAISAINVSNNGFARLVRTIIIGSANDTYTTFQVQKKLLDLHILNVGVSCILDGDMIDKKDSNGKLKYPPEDLLFFHCKKMAPERMLLDFYLKQHPDPHLQYNLESANPHCLFEKMFEIGLSSSKDNAFEMCWNELLKDTDGISYFNNLKDFLMRCRDYYSINF